MLTRRAGTQRAVAPTGAPAYVPGNTPGTLPTSGPRVGNGLGQAAPAVYPATPAFDYPFPFSRTGVFPFSQYNGPLGTLGIWPWITNAKMFFENTGYGAGTFVCSATSTTSGVGGNRRLAWTAGHCVNSGGTTGGPVGVWSTNVIICPAYRDGNSPVGCWPYLQLFTLGGWHADSNFRRDQGVVITGLSLGWRLGDRVGTQGLAWNQSRVQDYWAFGYPQAAPFNGNRLILCTAAAATDDSLLGPGAGPITRAIGCDMTGGSSGGGWIYGMGMGVGGFLNGVNSYKYIIPAQPLAMYGPYFDDGTLNLWNATKGLFP
jgi:hypothetical protein